MAEPRLSPTAQDTAQVQAGITHKGSWPKLAKHKCVEEIWGLSGGPERKTATTMHPPPGEGAGADNGGAVLGRANRGGELGVCGPMGEIKEAVEGRGGMRQN